MSTKFFALHIMAATAAAAALATIPPAPPPGLRELLYEISAAGAASITFNIPAPQGDATLFASSLPRDYRLEIEGCDNLNNQEVVCNSPVGERAVITLRRIGTDTCRFANVGRSTARIDLRWEIAIGAVQFDTARVFDLGGCPVYAPIVRR